MSKESDTGKANRDNHSNQLNPNNPAYEKSRKGNKPVSVNLQSMPTKNTTRTTT